MVRVPVFLPLHLHQSRHSSLKCKYLFFSCEYASMGVQGILGVYNETLGVIKVAKEGIGSLYNGCSQVIKEMIVQD